ncbi:MAG: DUF3800 domain-containing protein [Longimicrobiales bacterium]
MRIAYYDESGDDGYPDYSSELFALSAIYMHYLQWQPNFERIQEFRRRLRTDFGLPVKAEFHTKYFVLGKRPYRALRIPEADRLTVMGLMADLVGTLELKAISVVIAKPGLADGFRSVLDTALKFSVQRIENDLDPARNPGEKFMIITDPGRVGTMRSTTRRIQRINYIPSRFGPQPYRREITALIEDPMQKDSKESYFIQLADFMAYVVYLYAVFETGYGRIHGRTPTAVGAALVRSWLDRMLPSLNTRAARDDPYGVKIYPL